MHYVDQDGQLAHFLADPGRKIPEAHTIAVCKKDDGKKECRYLARTPNGCWCAKNTPIKTTLDDIVSKSTGGARGDNCPGFGPSLSQTK